MAYIHVSLEGFIFLYYH